MFRIAAAVNVEPGPCDVNVSFVGRVGSVIINDARLVFEWCNGVDVSDSWYAVGPGESAVVRFVDDDCVVRALWPSNTDSCKRKVCMISSAVIGEDNDIVTLGKIVWVRRLDCFPGLPAVCTDIGITARARFRRSPSLKRGADNVVGILWIDRNGNFSRVNCVWFSDANDSLRGHDAREN